MSSHRDFSNTYRLHWRSYKLLIQQMSEEYKVIGWVKRNQMDVSSSQLHRFDIQCFKWYMILYYTFSSNKSWMWLPMGDNISWVCDMLWALICPYIMLLDEITQRKLWLYYIKQIHYYFNEMCNKCYWNI